MATHTLLPLRTDATPLFDYNGVPTSVGSNVFVIPGVDIFPTGDADIGACLRVLVDGKYIDGPSNPFVAMWVFEDDAVIPVSSVINSVKFITRWQATGTGFYQGFSFAVSPTTGYFVGFGRLSNVRIDAIPSADVIYPFPVDVPPYKDFDADPTAQAGFGYVVAESVAFTTNPITGNPWSRAELFAFGSGGEYVWFFESGPDGGSDNQIDYVALVVDYQLVAPTGSWYFNPVEDDYQFFAVNPGPPWVVIEAPPLERVVLALEHQPCPWFLPTYIIRLTDQAMYLTFFNTYGFGTPIIVGLSPTDASNLTGVAISQDPSYITQSIWPQIFVHPDALTVLGVPISISDGGGRVNVPYRTPFGITCDHVLWKWQALVLWNPVGILLSPPNPPYTTVVVPPGALAPSGALLGGGGYGGGLKGGVGTVGGGLGPCGCPPDD